MKVTVKCEIGLCITLMQEIRKKAASNCCFNIINFTTCCWTRGNPLIIRNPCGLLITGENILFFPSTKRQIHTSLWGTEAVIIIVIVMREWSKPGPVTQDFNQSVAVPSAEGIRFKGTVKTQEFASWTWPKVLWNQWPWVDLCAGVCGCSVQLQLPGFCLGAQQNPGILIQSLLV